MCLSLQLPLDAGGKLLYLFGRGEQPRAEHGAHGVQLEFVKIGARFYTSAEALQRFLDRCRENNWHGVWNGRVYDALLERQRKEGAQ